MAGTTAGVFSMRRVMVTGNAGSGKTTVAERIAASTGIEYIGLDSVVWQPGWRKTPAPQRQERESAIAVTSRWVVDGVSLRLVQSADTVVFLDYPRYKCFGRVLLRNIPYLFRSRPGLPRNCPEIRIVSTLVRIIWRFPKTVGPQILSECIRTGTPLMHIRNDVELQNFLTFFGRSSTSLDPKPTR